MQVMVRRAYAFKVKILLLKTHLDRTDSRETKQDLYAESKVWWIKKACGSGQRLPCMMHKSSKKAHFQISQNLLREKDNSRNIEFDI